MPKVVLIGAVTSTKATLESLIKHKLDIVGVMGLEVADSTKVSGYRKLDKLCAKNDIPYKGFEKINDTENVAQLKEWAPDVIFAVGFSQLVSNEILSLPKLGCIGYHPTLLPKGRGRGPLAWLVLNEEKGASNFFLMGKGADDGPIFVQKEFTVGKDDYAEDIEAKMLGTVYEALDEWLPKLKGGEWNPIPQDEANATYYGKRGPLDGWIDWNNSAEDIYKLVRASANPHPGAFTYYDKFKVIILKAKPQELNITGVIGRVLLIEDGDLIVQTGNGLLRVQEYRVEDINGKTVTDKKLVVGSKMGYNIEHEIFKLKNKIL